MTITAVTPAKVPADTAARVVTITGTGFDEDYISSVGLGGDTDCDDLDSYVVQSPTTLIVKTPTGGCASSAGTPETVTISDKQSTPGTTTKGSAINFVPPPTLVTGQNDATPANRLKPVVTENSSGLVLANQVITVQATGSQTLRVKAAANFAFSNAASNTFSASLGGKPMTDIKVYDITANPIAPSTAALTNTNNGNFFTAKTPVLTPGTYPLVVSQNGVSATFAPAYTGLSVSTAPVVTSLDVTSGKTTGGTVVKITGTGFNPTVASYDGTIANILVCGNSVAPTAATATSLTFTTPAGGASATGLGASVYEGVCPVKVMNTIAPNAGTSVVTEKSYFVYLTS
jgi:IPT/TIG domain-containing protein